MKETTKQQRKVKSGGRGKIEPRWKPGESGNPKGRPKGKKNFETYFMEAWKEVAEALRMNKDPDKGKIEILKIGFKQIFKGNYQFWKDFMERLFGKVSERIELGADTELLEKLEKQTSAIAKSLGKKFTDEDISELAKRLNKS